jgi:DNA primase
MDTVVMHQFGFNNSVGTMGTAFGVNSAKILSNITRNIYLAMDSDDAGMKGMIRANEHFMKQGVLAKYISFHPAKDPDDFLNEFGRLELLDRIENAPVFLDSLIEDTIPKPIPSATDQKLEILNQIFVIISPLGDSLLASEKAINASLKLGLKSSSEDISQAYKDYIQNEQNKKERYSQYKKSPPKQIPQSEPHLESIPMPSDEHYIPSDEEHEEEKVEQKLHKAQEHVVSQLIIHPECLQSDQITEILDFIDNNEVQRLIRWLKDIYLEIDDSDYINVIKTKLESDLNSELKNLLAKALFDYTPTKLNEKVVTKLTSDLLYNLKKEDFKIKRDVLVKKQRAVVSDEESKEVLRLISEHDKEFIAFTRANK